MGLNVGGIYVQADRITQQDVVDTIRDYWLKNGARLSSRDPLDFRPLSLEKTGELGFAIAPPLPQFGGGPLWIAIYDSERYRCDWVLVRYLSTHFETNVWAFTMMETVDDALAMHYGKNEETLRGIDRVQNMIEPLPHAFLYFNKLREEVSAAEFPTFRFLAFEGVPHRSQAGYAGPSPQ